MRAQSQQKNSSESGGVMPNTPPSRGFNLLRHLPRLWNPGSTPVNKAGLNGLDRRLPQIDNPVVLGAAAVGAVGVGIALSHLRTSGRGGRSQRFTQWVSQAVGKALRDTPEEENVVHRVEVNVHEGFGKIPLVDVEVFVDETSINWTTLLAVDLLEQIARVVWDNPEIAPVAVRGRLLSAHDGHEITNMSALGCDSEVARPTDLYERFGAPASDPRWQG